MLALSAHPSEDTYAPPQRVEDDVGVLNGHFIRVHSWSEAEAILTPENERHLHNISHAFFRSDEKQIAFGMIASLALGLILSFTPALGGTYPALIYVGHVISGLNFLALTMMAVSHIRDYCEKRRHLDQLDNNPRLKWLVHADIRNLQQALQKDTDTLEKQRHELSQLNQRLATENNPRSQQSLRADIRLLETTRTKIAFDIHQKQAALDLLYSERA